MTVVRLLLLLVTALAVVGWLIAVSGISPWEVMVASAQGSVGDASALTGTLTRMTPLLLSGLGVAIGLKAGLFNIGVEGQLVVGALAAAATGIYVSGLPPILHVPCCLLAGVAAGLLWALPAGLIKVWRGGHEVITTIMLNYIARLLTKYLAANPMQDPDSEMATTVYVAKSARLGSIGGELSVSLGLLLGLFCAAILAFWLRRTVWGYELRVVGANQDAALAAGIDVRLTLVMAMAASGAFAGLAGAVQVTAYEFRFYDGISPGYGFDSLAVALIAFADPIGVCASAFVFGAIAQGAQYAQIATDIPKEIVAVIQGIVILLAAAVGWQRLRRSD